jgi:hypothetical protein
LGENTEGIAPKPAKKSPSFSILRQNGIKNPLAQFMILNKTIVFIV